MSLIDNWKSVLLRAWSARLALLAAAFSAAEVALPYLTDFVPPHAMAILSILTAAGAALSRIVAQPAMRNESQST